MEMPAKNPAPVFRTPPMPFAKLVATLRALAYPK